MNRIFKSAMAAVFSMSFSKNLLESMMRWDFKEGGARENLMQLCFSGLASWLLMLMLLVVSVLPPNLIPLQTSDAFADNSLMLFLLDGHLTNMLVVAFLIFVLNWLFRIEGWLILLLALLVKFSWLHVNVAIAGLLGILLSAICYRWWAVMDIKSEARRVWNALHRIQLAAFLLTSVAGIYYLDQLQINGLFSEKGFNRIHFLAIVTAAYYGLNFLMMSVYGHFYFQRKVEPHQLQMYFSTAYWILRFRLSRSLHDDLRKKAEGEIVKHQEHLKNFIDLKKSSPGLATLPMEKVLLSEIDHLKEAILRLSRV